MATLYIMIRKNVTGISERKSEDCGGFEVRRNKRYGYNKKNVPYVKFISVSGKYPISLFRVNCRQSASMWSLVLIMEHYDKHPVGQIENILVMFQTNIPLSECFSLRWVFD